MNDTAHRSDARCGPVQRIVGLVAAESASELELAIVASVFGPDHSVAPRSGDAGRRYELRVCAAGPGTVALRSGFSVTASHGLDGLAEADTVVIPNGVQLTDGWVQALRDALHRVHGRGGRIVALGSGVVVLDVAGLLPVRGATTHWAVAQDRRHRDLRLDASALYAQSGRVITAAGAAATLDLCLDLVRQDHGATVAGDLARRVLAAPHRAGGVPQNSRPFAAASKGLGELLVWATERLDQPLSLAELARAANVSSRTLARRFHAALGTSPARWLLTQRIRLAQELLETTGHSIDRIARLSGLGSASNLRRQFIQIAGESPRDYRRRFLAAVPDPTGGHGVDAEPHLVGS
ncbi:GlxA family transcriptional regulator [Pseudonocardia lacus]|uniref:GlxA family transcriptional regulator n=1 Tax=Pseudonocardia lacus TaxID=2835865 RepID=UPI0027E37F4B|nr:helix-turn-helix domain-containing protein [Pseudonocardia lacus]